MGGRRRRTAVVSLRDRALAALAIGISVLAALGVFAAAEAAAGHPLDPRLDAEGSALFSAFSAADQTLADHVRGATDIAAAAVERQSARHNQIFYSGLAVEALVLLVLAVAVMRSVVRPLARLTRTAEELAAGQETRVPYADRLDEVGSLARALAGWQTSSADMLSVFERSPIGICRLSTGGVILEANPSLERMLGYSSGELDGRPYRDLTPEVGHYGELVTGLRERVAVETRYQRRDGSHFWGSLTVSPVHNLDGAVDYFVAMIEDIDHRKRQEFELLHRAGHDSLTGLPNRSLFDDRLEQALRAARRRRGKVAVLVLDLDR